jgi:hypothetical protein
MTPPVGRSRRAKRDSKERGADGYFTANASSSNGRGVVKAGIDRILSGPIQGFPEWLYRGQCRRLHYAGARRRSVEVRHAFGRRALSEYLRHYNHERNRQGRGNRILSPSPEDRVGESQGSICRRARLGGLLKFYRRRAG